MTSTSSTSSPRRCSIGCLPTGATFWCGPRSWIACAARCVTRCSAAPGQPPPLKRWSGPTCSWSYWMLTGSGTDTTGCFGTVLSRELQATSPQALPELLRRAADWYLAAGHVDEAVRQLTAAGERRKAGQLLLSAEDAFLEQGTAATYLRLGEQLGKAAVHDDPRLAVSMAGAAAQSGQGDRVPTLLDVADAGSVNAVPAYPGWCSLEAAAAMLRATCDRA
jgi:hypothetical protein